MRSATHSPLPQIPYDRQQDATAGTGGAFLYPQRPVATSNQHQAKAISAAEDRAYAAAQFELYEKARTIRNRAIVDHSKLVRVTNSKHSSQQHDKMKVAKDERAALINVQERERHRREEIGRKAKIRPAQPYASNSRATSQERAAATAAANAQSYYQVPSSVPQAPHSRFQSSVSMARSGSTILGTIPSSVNNSLERVSITTPQPQQQHPRQLQGYYQRGEEIAVEAVNGRAESLGGMFSSPDAAAVGERQQHKPYILEVIESSSPNQVGVRASSARNRSNNNVNAPTTLPSTALQAAQNFLSDLQNPAAGGRAEAAAPLHPWYEFSPPQQKQVYGQPSAASQVEMVAEQHRRGSEQVYMSRRHSEQQQQLRQGQAALNQYHQHHDATSIRQSNRPSSGRPSSMSRLMGIVVDDDITSSAGDAMLVGLSAEGGTDVGNIGGAEVFDDEEAAAVSYVGAGGGSTVFRPAPVRPAPQLAHLNHNPNAYRPTYGQQPQPTAHPMRQYADREHGYPPQAQLSGLDGQRQHLYTAPYEQHHHQQYPDLEAQYNPKHHPTNNPPLGYESNPYKAHQPDIMRQQYNELRHQQQPRPHPSQQYHAFDDGNQHQTEEASQSYDEPSERLRRLQEARRHLGDIKSGNPFQQQHQQQPSAKPSGISPTKARESRRVSIQLPMQAATNTNNEPHDHGIDALSLNEHNFNSGTFPPSADTNSSTQRQYQYVFPGNTSSSALPSRRGSATAHHQIPAVPDHQQTASHYHAAPPLVSEDPRLSYHPSSDELVGPVYGRTTSGRPQQQLPIIAATAQSEEGVQTTPIPFFFNHPEQQQQLTSAARNIVIEARDVGVGDDQFAYGSSSMNHGGEGGQEDEWLEGEAEVGADDDLLTFVGDIDAFNVVRRERRLRMVKEASSLAASTSSGIVPFKAKHVDTQFTTIKPTAVSTSRNLFNESADPVKDGAHTFGQPPTSGEVAVVNNKSGRMPSAVFSQEKTEEPTDRTTDAQLLAIFEQCEGNLNAATVLHDRHLPAIKESLAIETKQLGVFYGQTVSELGGWEGIEKASLNAKDVMERRKERQLEIALLEVPSAEEEAELVAAEERLQSIWEHIALLEMRQRGREQTVVRSK